LVLQIRIFWLWRAGREVKLSGTVLDIFSSAADRFDDEHVMHEAGLTWFGDVIFRVFSLRSRRVLEA
jgi:hypothetical protein